MKITIELFYKTILLQDQGSSTNPNIEIHSSQQDQVITNSFNLIQLIALANTHTLTLSRALLLTSLLQTLFNKFLERRRTARASCIPPSQLHTSWHTFHRLDSLYKSVNMWFRFNTGQSGREENANTRGAEERSGGRRVYLCTNNTKK